MSFILDSANMNLPIPVTGQEIGPDYANDINACLMILDGHNHAAGAGVQINPNGINLNSDLPFNVNNATLLRSVRFSPQVAVLAGATDLGCLYEVGVDLYYNDGSGNHVRITQSGGVAGSPGSIAGLASPASATYISGSSTFVWQSAANTPANMDNASVILRNLVANSKGLTLAPPAAMGSDFTITLPSLPISQKIVTLDASGNMGAVYDVDNVTLEVSSSLLQVKDLGISTAKLAALSVTAAKVANATLTGTQMSSDINFPGSAVQENGKNLVVSNTNATNSMALVRGTIGATGTTINGEGFTATNPSAGTYNITITTAFGDSPVVVVTPNSNSPFYITVSAITSSTFTVISTNTSVALQNVQFCFTAIGQRA